MNVVGVAGLELMASFMTTQEISQDTKDPEAMRDAGEGSNSFLPGTCICAVMCAQVQPGPRHTSRLVSARTLYGSEFLLTRTRCGLAFASTGLRQGWR